MQQKFNIEDTRKIAKIEASKAKAGDVFMLIGDLGAGKSTFAKFFIETLNLEYQGSPTFGYINYYEKPKLIHIDMYNNGKSIMEEIIEHTDSIILIEWPTKEMLSIFNNPTKIIFHLDGESRWIERNENARI